MTEITPNRQQPLASQILRVPTFVQQLDRLQCTRATTPRSPSPVWRSIGDQNQGKDPRPRRPCSIASTCNLHGRAQVFERRQEDDPENRRRNNFADCQIACRFCLERGGANLCGLLIVRQQPLEWRQVFGRASHVNISSAWTMDTQPRPTTDRYSSHREFRIPCADPNDVYRCLSTSWMDFVCARPMALVLSEFRTSENYLRAENYLKLR